MSNPTTTAAGGKKASIPNTKGRVGQSRSVAGSKSCTLKALMSRRNGATISQLQNKLDWQPHTIRAAISRLRKAGVTIDLDRSGKSPRYRIISHGSHQ
ncbi:DUF3489 domain-containing protein [Shimia sediminis]|uniref:DUF3489 domain-containing protein n=1 Tax=Shimia sediminis TaxID=2497945 RepID=UPI000F8DEFED